MVCAPVRSIIPSLKLGDYLSVQAHKPCSISHVQYIIKYQNNSCDNASRLRPEFFYFLVLGSADPNFWKSRIKIKLGSKSFIFILSADRLMPSTNKIKARTIFLG